MASRVLVVEDDELQQDVLKSALEKSGYVVDVASDGLQAVRKLRTGQFDLALVDYHIPEVDGLASAKLLQELMEKGTCPKLVAITADFSGLLARGGDKNSFDAIVQKPLDLTNVLTVIKDQLKGNTAEARLEAANAIWRENGLVGAPAALVVPAPTRAQLQLLQSLFDVNGREPDVILIVKDDGFKEAISLRENSDLSHCPIIDLTSHFSEIADGSLIGFDSKRLKDIANTIRQFSDRRRALVPSFQTPSGTEGRLLAYLYQSGQTLHPVRFAESGPYVRYGGFFSAPEIAGIAERLERRGLLEKAFFDRFHVCAQCDSSHVNVREECPSCRSSHLREESLIHHFRCAHQAPESEFTQGRDLVCPKCSQHLLHYGSDYDKPGEVFVCAGCGHICSDVAVGFVCLVCGTHTDSDAMPKRDIYSYRLTDTATRLMTSGGGRVLSLPEPSKGLPERLSDELFRLSNDTAAKDQPLTLAAIRYGAEEGIVAERGRTAFDKLRGIFLQNLKSALPGPVELYSAADRDYLLARSDLTEIDENLLKFCQDTLAERLEPIVEQLDPFAQVRSA
jgi:CheY-like chemotaxis protein